MKNFQDQDHNRETKTTCRHRDSGFSPSQSYLLWKKLL